METKTVVCRDDINNNGTTDSDTEHMETRELYWLHTVLQSRQTALEPEDTCRQAASTIHMHPRSPESLLLALPWFPSTGSGLLGPMLGAGMWEKLLPRDLKGQG